MSTGESDELGFGSDTVILQLKEEKLVIAEDYEVKCAILTQPAAFSISLGWGKVVKELIAKYPPNTPFKLTINNRLIQSGSTDAFEASGDAQSGTKIVFRGRDALAPLHDSYVNAERSYSNATYVQIVEKALKDVGLGDAPLFLDNAANRKAVTGANIKQVQAPRNVEEITLEGGAGPIRKTVQTRLGERYYDFVKRHLDRAGLFLWAAGAGGFVLSEPNRHQNPTYQILRRAEGSQQAGNVVRHSYKFDTARRFSSCIIYARGSSKKYGGVKSTGAFVDEEMVNPPISITGKHLTLRDVNCKSAAQAEFIARRKIAEARRESWSLEYTVAGHTVKSLYGGVAVWSPDTVVHVEDEEYGIADNFYIESVTYSRNPQTTTQLRLMRLQDLVFGADE